MVDRTYIAVKRQLKAMAATGYEIGVGPVVDKHGQVKLNDKGEPVFNIRVWDEAAILKSVTWLKHQNRFGANIYIRPEGSQGLLLMDDLTIKTLDRLENDGLDLACVTETSPLNYQVWVRASFEPLDNALASSMARVLATAYRTDMNSADWRHFGRLAGFTNRKPHHVQENGRFPFVLLRSATGQFLSERLASGLIRRGKEELEKREQEIASRATLKIEGHHPKINAVEFFDSEIKGLMKKYGSDYQGSHADWMITLKMLSRGYSEDDIKVAMREASPDIETRKAGHVDHYIDLTISKAKERFSD